MMKRRLPRRVTALFCAVALLVSLGSALPTAAKTKEQLQQEISELQKKEKQIKSQLADASSDLSASQKRYSLLDQQMTNAEAQLAVYNSQISSLNGQMSSVQSEVSSMEKQIAAQEAEIADTRDKLGQRLRAIMKSGNVTTLQLLMNTQSYEDYLLKSMAIRRVSSKDQSAIDRLEASIKKIEAEKATLESKKSDLQAKKSEIEQTKAVANAKKRELEQVCAAASSEMRKLQSSVSTYNQQIKDTEKLIEKANQDIAKLIRESSTNSVYNNKMMYWPVPTVRALSDVFGPRWGKNHNGIDIANGKIPIYGENIVAAADGTVIAANYTSYYGTGWSYGYGYSCIIDHGKDSKGRKVTTLYAHCSVLYARVGQKVVGGKTVIGQAGKSGHVTGPHLHFEVRLDGTPVNPLYTYVSPKVN